jgi:hypothetical protein
VALVDGARHQIDRIKAEAKAAKVEVTVVVDFVHVLDELCLHYAPTFPLCSLGPA